MQDKRVQNFLRRKEEKYPNKINQYILAQRIRLVGDNVEQAIYNLSDALVLAKEQQLDLVEISPNADPPVCRIVDYQKFLYEKKKREKEMKSNAKKQEMKEIRFTPNTDDHDFEFKSKHAEKFLKDGDKVRAYVQFKGRAIVFRERGELLLLRFAQKLEECGVPDGLPKMEGKKMFITINPKGKK